MLDEERPGAAPRSNGEGERYPWNEGNLESRTGDAPPRRDPAPKPGRSEGAGESDASKSDADAETNAKRPSLLRRHPFRILLAVLLVALACAGGYWYWLVYSHPFETTDDAFIDSRQFAVSPKIPGAIVEVPVEDNQHVNVGDTLFRIDPRDYEAALAEAKARVAAAQAAVNGADAQIAAQQAQVEETRSQVEQAQASLEFAKQEAARAQELVRSGAGTVQTAQQQTSNLQQQEAALTRARAGVVSAQKQVGSLQAQKATSLADLREAEAQQMQAELNLTYVTVQAAQPGRLVRLTGAVGQYVQAGQSLAMFVPDEIWVTANFKETQITDMRPGQPVDIRIDAYPDHEIRGHVDSVQPGSGTAFSLLPAENATGNYVKVVQRVPVKIVADNWPTDVSIGPGMSVVPTITVRPRD
ncbi:HlyD family secretion protein [Aureimonas sp. AU40]|uniref:HlyD family secretion protein n=1 Tax=Aureimonas sp. AU40 TaxID=1637747 RepID=UPI000782C2FF|nr:HlyD family secretion protein [Aureimonas sp. AU40]